MRKSDSRSETVKYVAPRRPKQPAKVYAASRGPKTETYPTPLNTLKKKNSENCQV